MTEGYVKLLRSGEPGHELLFDPRLAEVVKPRLVWDGGRWISVQPTSPRGDVALVNTWEGHWALCHARDRYQPERYEMVNEGEALRWLVLNKSHDVIWRHFGDLGTREPVGRHEPAPMELVLRGELTAAGREELERIDLAGALIVPGLSRWAGNGLVRYHVTSAEARQWLVHTDGRWFVHERGDWQGPEGKTDEVPRIRALRWLLINESTTVIRDHFGQVPVPPPERAAG